MREDPRHRNQHFDATSIGAYLTGYAAGLKAALETVDAVALARACEAVEQAAVAGRRIHAIGNGGSAAVADHLSCDWTKGTHHHGHPPIRARSLVSNVALYSAIANDFGFEEVFATQLAFEGDAGDVLVAISSSGNSPNILQAVAEAKERGILSIGLSGFSGGALKSAADVSLYVAANNYGIVEDAHQALMHVITQFLARRRDQP